MNISREEMNKYFARGLIPFTFKLEYDAEKQHKEIQPPFGYNKFDENKTNHIRENTGLAVRTGWEYQTGRYLILIDIDDKVSDGVDNGYDLWNLWKNEDDTITDTVHETTPSNGEHYYYYADEEQQTNISNSRTTLEYNNKTYAIDFKFKNQFSIIAPSYYIKNGVKCEYKIIGKSLINGTIKKLPNIIYDTIKNVKKNKKINTNNTQQITDTITNTTISTNTKVSSELITELLNCLEPSKYSGSKQWSNLCLLLRNYGMRNECHNFCAKMENYNAKEIDDMFNKPLTNTNLTIKTLLMMARIDNNKMYESVCIQFENELKQFNNMKLEYNNIMDILQKEYKQREDKIHFNECTRYITDHAKNAISEALKIEYNSVILSAVTGAGKTTMTNKIINDVNNKTKSILAVSVNRSIAEKLHNDFNLDCYNFNGMLLPTDRFICSFEKLHIIDRKYDIIVLDEINSLLSHITSTTMKYKNKSWSKLIDLTTNAETVICCDATITDNIFNFLNNCKRKTFYYENTFMNWKGVSLTMYFRDDVKVEKIIKNRLTKKQIENGVEQTTRTELKYRDDLQTQIIIKNYITPLFEKIALKKSIIIPCDSKSSVDTSRFIITEYLISIKWSEKDIKDYVRIFTCDEGKTSNINTKFFTNRCIIFSPKIVMGISIDKELIYDTDTIYSIYSGNSLNGFMIYQQLCRARGMIGNINCLWLDRTYKHGINYITTIEKVIENAKINVKNINEIKDKIYKGYMECIKDVSDRVNGNIIFSVDECNKQSMLENQIFHDLYYDTLFKQNKSQCVISLCERSGFKIIRKDIEILNKDKIKIPNQREITTQVNLLTINGKLKCDNDCYDIAVNKINSRLNTINDLGQLKNEKVLNITTDDTKNEYCHIAMELYKPFNDILKKFEAMNPNATIAELNKNKCAVISILIQLNEIIKNKKRIDNDFNIKPFDLECIVGDNYDTLYKWIIDHKLELSYAKYGSSTSKKRLDERINEYVLNIKNIDNIKELIADLYNKYAPFYKKKLIKNSRIGDMRKREYAIIKNDEVFEEIKTFIDIQKSKDMKEVCMFE